MAATLSLAWIYLTLVLASGNGPGLLDNLKAESELGKWLAAFYILFLLRNSIGKIGQALFALVLITTVINIGPDVTTKINSMIDDLIK
jgi:hypothetical protein